MLGSVVKDSVGVSRQGQCWGQLSRAHKESRSVVKDTHTVLGSVVKDTVRSRTHFHLNTVEGVFTCRKKRKENERRVVKE